MSNHEFDPNNFDWDGPVGIPQEVVADAWVSIVGEAVSRQAKPEVKYARREALRQSPGEIFAVQHAMSDEKQARLLAEYPGITFQFDRAVRQHDHPYAHVTTELNERTLVGAFRDELYVDMFGNGNRNRKYGRNCITTYSLETPRDYVRYRDAGALGMVKHRMQDFVEKGGKFAGIKNLSMTHSLYYLNPAQVSQIVNAVPGRRLRALVHRHDQVHGTLNCGEQEYWVMPDGRVRQENTGTGEAYTHRSVEALFHQTSAAFRGHGMAWTVTACSPGSFIIEFVGAPPDICEEWVGWEKKAKVSTLSEASTSVTIKSVFGWKWVSKASSDRVVALTDVALFDDLRRYVSCKERTPQLRKDLATLARRLTNKKDMVAIHGGGAYDVPVGSLQDYVLAAFYCDVDREVDVAMSYHLAFKERVDTLNGYYAEQKVPVRLEKFVAAARDVKNTLAALGQGKSVSSVQLNSSWTESYAAVYRRECEAPDIRPKSADRVRGADDW